jgi:hypothetical protein
MLAALYGLTNSLSDLLYVLEFVDESRDIQQESDMIPRIAAENISTLVNWSFVTIVGDMLPPRDPNDDDDEDKEDEQDEEDKKEEPAVIREPDE